MKFYIQRASLGLFFEKRYKPHEEAVWDNNLKSWTIEIDDLSKLLLFIGDLFSDEGMNQRIILSYEDDISLPVITIYDDFVEQK